MTDRPVLAPDERAVQVARVLTALAGDPDLNRAQRRAAVKAARRVRRPERTRRAY